MLDKLRLWNFVSLHDSMLQYRKSKNKLEHLMLDRLDIVWNTLSEEDIEWLDANAFNEPYGWDRPTKTKEVLELVKNVGKPVEVIESLTVQLKLFDL